MDNYSKNGLENKKSQVRLNGFDIQNAFKALSLYFPCASIFTEASNIAGATDNYLINRSQSHLAEVANVSLRTAARFCKMAQQLNMVEIHAVYDEKSRARLANVYKLTPTFLRFASTLRDETKPKKITIGNHIKAFKVVVAKLLTQMKFKLTPPMPKEHTPPCQTGITNNKYTSSKVRKIETGAVATESLTNPEETKNTQLIDKPESAPITHKILKECLAKGKARRANERRQEERTKASALRHVIQQKATKLAQQINHYQSKATKKTALCNKSFLGDYSQIDYTAPSGFRSA